MFLVACNKEDEAFQPVDLQNGILCNCTRSQVNPAFLVNFHTEFSHRIPDENAYDDESHLLDILDLRFAF